MKIQYDASYCSKTLPYPYHNVKPQKNKLQYDERLQTLSVGMSNMVCLMPFLCIIRTVVGMNRAQESVASDRANAELIVRQVRLDPVLVPR
jgi:hypothetical protein